MFRLAAVVVVLLAAALPARADDITPVLTAGVWYFEEGMIMRTRCEFTFRKDGTFKVEVLNDVPNPRITGTWKVVVKDGKSQLTLTSKDGACLPAESEVRFDKAKSVLIVRGKDGAEVVLKYRRGP